MPVWCPGTHRRVSSAKAQRRALPVHAQARRHLYADGQRLGAPAGDPLAASEDSPHQLSPRLHATCQAAKPRDSSGGRDPPAASAGGQAVACESDEAQPAPRRLGDSSPAHIRQRRAAVPLWWQPHHQGPLLNPQGRLTASSRSPVSPRACAATRAERLEAAAPGA